MGATGASGLNFSYSYRTGRVKQPDYSLLQNWFHNGTLLSCTLYFGYDKIHSNKRKVGVSGSKE